MSGSALDRLTSPAGWQTLDRPGSSRLNLKGEKMVRSRYSLIAVGILCAGAFAAAASTLARAVDNFTEAIVWLFDLAFKAEPTLYLDRDAHTTVRVLGAAPARSFRERRLARESDARRRAPLSAAFA